MCVYNLDVIMLIRIEHSVVLLRLQAIESDRIAMTDELVTKM